MRKPQSIIILVSNLSIHYYLYCNLFVGFIAGGAGEGVG